MELRKFNNNYLRTVAAAAAFVGAYALTGCSKEPNQGATPTSNSTEQAPSTNPSASPSESTPSGAFQVSGVTGGGDTVITIDPQAMQNNLGGMVANMPQNFVPKPADIPKLPAVNGPNIDPSKDFCNDPTLSKAIETFSGPIVSCDYDPNVQYDQEAYYTKSVDWMYTSQDGKQYGVSVGFFKNKDNWLNDSPGTGDPSYKMGGYVCNENSSEGSLTIQCDSVYGTVSYTTDTSDPSLNPNKARMEAAISLYVFSTK